MKLFSRVSLILFVFLFCAKAVGGVLESYEIGAGDTIGITVYAEDELSKEVLINSSGKFDYPYIGPLQAQGRTTGELQSLITNKLKGDYLIDPKVMVNVVEYRKIYVNGEVKKPGGYSFQPKLTVDKAIALAGGFTDRAAKDKIILKSNLPDSNDRVVDLEAFVKPGDIIIIDQSFF